MYHTGVTVSAMADIQVGWKAGQRSPIGGELLAGEVWRGGRLSKKRWNRLTSDERRQAKFFLAPSPADKEMSHSGGAVVAGPKRVSLRLASSR